MRTPIDDKDYVLARFRTDKPAAPDRRETVTIPGRAGATGSRSVQVVHVRSGEAIPDRARRARKQSGVAAWGGVFDQK